MLPHEYAQELEFYYGDVDGFNPSYSAVYMFVNFGFEDSHILFILEKEGQYYELEEFCGPMCEYEPRQWNPQRIHYDYAIQRMIEIEGGIQRGYLPEQ